MRKYSKSSPCLHAYRRLISKANCAYDGHAVVAGRVSIMTIAIVLDAIFVDAQGSSFEVTVNKVTSKACKQGAPLRPHLPTLQATGVLGCACLLVFVSPNYCMRIGHPGHPGGSRHTGRKRFHGFRAPDTYGGPRPGSHSAQQARRRGLSCRLFVVS